MKKQYKHIPTGNLATESNSGKNYIVSELRNFTVPSWIVEGSKEWVEVKEKGFEIVRVINCHGTILTYNGETCIHRTDNHDLSSTFSLGQTLKTNAQIYSVKRISDNEIFSIGDAVHLISGNWYKDDCKISIITVENDNVIFKIDQHKFGSATYNHGINAWRKVKRIPLFITEDLVPIFIGDTYWVYDQDMQLNSIHSVRNASQTHTGDGVGRKYFSTKEKAEEFRLMNSKVLCVKDVVNTITNIGTGSVEAILKDLGRVVESRI